MLRLKDAHKNVANRAPLLRNIEKELNTNFLKKSRSFVLFAEKEIIRTNIEWTGAPLITSESPEFKLLKRTNVQALNDDGSIPRNCDYFYRTSLKFNFKETSPEFLMGYIPRIDCLDACEMHQMFNPDHQVVDCDVCFRHYHDDCVKSELTRRGQRAAAHFACVNCQPILDGRNCGKIKRAPPTRRG
jgi:hypothetical protein